MKDYEEKIIFTSLVGSRGYGTHTEESDEDFIHVFLEHPFHYLGLKGTSNKQKLTEDSDMTSYEFRNFVNLCLKANPNVFVALYSENITFDPRYGKQMYDYRNDFISQRVFHTFTGYATSQYKRMTGELTGKMGSKRKELVDQFGYDTKYAYHTIRLLRMATEILRYGTVLVKRTYDVEFLKNVRKGYFNLQEIKDIIENEYSLCKKAYEITELPKEPYFNRINQMVFDVLFLYVNDMQKMNLNNR